MDKGSALLSSIRENVIGQYAPMDTPFGVRPLVYADYTASGRSLRSIEAQIQEQVLPWYANTHSETSFTGAQSTSLREQARRIIHSALNAGEDDRIIFCGSGATAAINRLIDILNLRLPHDLDQRYGFSEQIPEHERPVVFVGPYEHHSNELPWRESIADVVAIPLSSVGAIDTQALAVALEAYADRKLLIGAFSAASNVTGVRSDVAGITRQLKAAGALAFWDYAAAGPYVGIDMNLPGAPIDAVFVSPHKFIGGPGTPGILAVKATLLGNTVPAVVGGGTVAFVSPDDHRFLDDLERREEGGTPAIVETIRAGLVFRLQQMVSTDEIERIERDKVDRVLRRLGAHPGIDILGGTAADRLSIVSMRFRCGESCLHYGFVVALLNDLFGIQARGGCSCAGPYGHSLLGLDLAASRALDQAVAAGETALRPGWVRLNFNYFIDDEEFDYLLRALELVAEHGWRLLPAYCLDVRSGLWRHRSSGKRALPADLEAIDLFASAAPQTAHARPDFARLLDEGEAVLRTGAAHEHVCELAAEQPWCSEHAHLRWFTLGQEVMADLA
jgi:selenocysteine lyase/cysteine desulfurase